MVLCYYIHSSCQTYEMVLDVSCLDIDRHDLMVWQILATSDLESRFTTLNCDYAFSKGMMC